MWREYALTVGLPQTNYRNLAEAKLLMEACNFFWRGLGEAIQCPVAQLRSAQGDPVYATIAFVEERFPMDRTLQTFHLDDRLRCLLRIRAIKNLATECLMMFDREDRLAAPLDAALSFDGAPPYPVVRFGSIFAAPGPGNGRLKLTVPANATFQDLAALPLEDNPIQVTRRAQETGRLDVIPPNWVSLDADAPPEVSYTIDPDRDTNAAGLVYFANYIAFLEMGERSALPRASAWPHPSTSADPAGRQLLHRRVAYFENAGLSDRVAISVSRFASPTRPDQLGLRYQLVRASDRKLICLSEALMTFAPSPQLPERRASEPHRAGVLP